MIQPNTTKGVYLVIRFLRRDKDVNLYLVQCTACRTKREASANLLRMADKTNSIRCGSCQWSTTEPRPHTKMCPVCCNMTWARPLNKPCRCGKLYEREQIERPSIQQSSAGFAMDNCASSYRVGVRIC